MKKYILSKSDLILDLMVAFQDAKKHKSKKKYVLEFEQNLGKNIEHLAEELLSKTYKPLPSTCFIVNSYTKREVFAAQFRDRVVHHLYFNYTHNLFERTFIQDTYSCIKNRGTHYGIDRLEKKIISESNNYSRECFIMKLDIRGYFMHINREKLCSIASESIIKMSTHKINKNSNLVWSEVIDIDFILWLTREIALIDPTINCHIVGSKKDWRGLDKNKSLFNTEKGCGLPIGNLTSQLFSNVYLNIFDQFMKRELKCKHYGRYVDDAYVVSKNKEFLLSVVPKIKNFLKQELGLELHMGKLKLQKSTYGVEFLGAFLKPHRRYICNHSLKRMVTKAKFDYNNIEETYSRVNSYLGILSHYSSYNIRCNLFLTKFFLKISYYTPDMRKMIKPYMLGEELLN